MNFARVWFDTALGFLAFLLVMAIYGFAAGNAIGPYGYYGLLVFEVATIAVLVVVTFRKPTWLHRMFEDSRRENQARMKERSLALIGQVKFYQGFDSNKVFVHVGFISMLLVLSKHLDPFLFWILFWIQAKNLMATLRRSTSMARRFVGVMIALVLWLVLLALSCTRMLVLERQALALLFGVAIPMVVEESYVLWQDVKRAKKLKAQCEILNVLQSHINQVSIQ